MLVDQLKSKVDDLEYLHTSLGSVAIQNHNLNIYGKEIPFTKTSRPRCGMQRANDGHYSACYLRGLQR
jgi:hypothetical protein